MKTWKGISGLPMVGLAWLVIVAVLSSVVSSLDPDIQGLGSDQTVDTSSEGNKRAAFNAWAGKRDYLGNFDEDELKLKRPAFNAWAGKRSALSEDEKRAAFSAWAGKRSGDEESFSEEKRAAFNAWAGKRSFGWADDDAKRAAFNAWAGKRSALDEAPEDKRTMSFSSWAGKRESGTEDADLENFNEADKRAAFSSWAGKRSYQSTLYNLRLLDWYLSRALAKVMEKRKFSAWAGKRDNRLTRRRFGPWSG